MQSLKHLIKHAVRRAGITQQVSAAQIVAAVNQFLDQAALPQLRSFVQVISFQHGVLKVTCQNAVASHEVKSLESGIREAIGKADPKAELRQLAIHIGSAAYDL